MIVVWDGGSIHQGAAIVPSSRGFGEEFIATAVQAFVARYVTTDAQRELLRHQATLTFLDYDWALNAQARQRPQ